MSRPSCKTRDPTPRILPPCRSQILPTPQTDNSASRTARSNQLTAGVNAPTHNGGPQSLADLFGEPISLYTDADAIEDDFIVDLSHLRVVFRGLPVNRMTRHLFDDLKPDAKVVKALPEVDFDKSLASLLRIKCQFAQGSSDNTGEVGDIWRIPPKLWLVLNKLGGWTAMYPEDY